MNPQILTRWKHMCGRSSGNGRSVLDRRFIDLIIVVDDLPFGIADFLTADI